MDQIPSGGVERKQDTPENIEPKNAYWKFVLAFIGVIIAVFLLYIIGFWIAKTYQDWRHRKNLDNLVEAMKQAEADDYARAMADTYGSTTPQGTLKMYIDAVQKGDYELASKYFIGDYQQRELESLRAATKEDLSHILKLLKEDLSSPGSFSTDKKGFLIEKPLIADFKIYPNGIWKIIEI